MKAAAFATVAFALTACGTPRAEDASTVQTRIDIPANHITLENAQAFIAHAKQNLAAGQGVLTSAEFLDIMPMTDDQRSIIADAYPNPFQVACENGRCSATADGAAAQATMDVTLVLISSPTLAVADHVQADYVLRGDDAVEFCNVEGMVVKKFFTKKKIQGIHLTVAGGAPTLTVNVDESTPYTCD